MKGQKNIIILVKVRDVMNLPKFSFFTEMGNVIQQLDDNITREEYVVWAMIHSEPRIRSFDNNFLDEYIMTTKKYLRNHTQSSIKVYHFGTTRRIDGFGFGPVYTSNMTTYCTIGKIAKSL